MPRLGLETAAVHAREFEILTKVLRQLSLQLRNLAFDIGLLGLFVLESLLG